MTEVPDASARENLLTSPAGTDAVYRSAFEMSANPLLLLDCAAETAPLIVEVNVALEGLLGLSRGRLIGQNWLAALGLDADVGELMSAHCLAGAIERTVQCRRAGMATFWCRVQMQALPESAGANMLVLCTLHDVSDYVESERMREFLTTHDMASGLVRAHVLKESLSAEVVRAIDGCYRLIVCHVDLDRFGIISESYGFDSTEEVICQLAGRLSACAQDKRLVCRMGTDKFVMAFVDTESMIDQLELGETIAAALAAPLSLQGIELQVTASIGVSCFPDTAASKTELLQQAAMAANVAKREGGDSIHVFSQSELEHFAERLKLGELLRGAVQRDEMEIHYQPVISAAKREITGMEALVRWRHPDLGLVMPERFIRLAEDLGLIAEIGRWVLRNACLQARRWLDLGVGEFTLSVNVSGLQMRGQQLLEDVSRALDNARLPARFLELELTESVIMGDVEHVTFIMRELRKMGVNLAMDDFGVGQSSLGSMQRLSVNRLKIDRSFVSAVPDNVSAARICRAVIALSHEFGFTVVAEGVETPAQLSFLERNGCEFIQGNYFSAAVDADTLLSMLRRPQLHPRETAEGSHGDTILLVDDEQNVVRALARLLRRDGYRIFTATSFNEAFDILGNNDVQVVVSDHRMPDGKGTEFLGRVKATHPNTIRMILSGYADLGAVTEAINGGAVYRFLTKPWNDNDLRETMRAAMRLAHAAETS